MFYSQNTIEIATTLVSRERVSLSIIGELNRKLCALCSLMRIRE